jgi:site-specific DNA-methyltransferase (adenine-specific)
MSDEVRSMTLEVDRIYCGDCLDLMKEIPDKSVNLVLTDPPYGIGYQSNWCKDGPRFEKIVNDDALCIEWLPDAFRVTSPDGSLVCFCRWDVEGEFKEAIEECGYRVKSQIVWDRVVHGMGDLKGQFAPRHDVAWFATVSERFEFKGQRPPSVLAFQRPPPEAMIHPTQKPIALFERLILSLTSPGDTVLDPFLGSGTTAIACLRTGRHYIGIEKHEPYFLKAQERIDKERAQVRLFDLPYLHECLVRQRREELEVPIEPARDEQR